MTESDKDNIESELEKALEQQGLTPEIIKLFAVDKILPQDHRQNTQIIKDEQVLLTLLKGFADYCGTYGHSSTAKNLIESIIIDYTTYAVGLSRKGRKEAVDVLKNLFNKEREEETEKVRRFKEFLQS